MGWQPNVYLPPEQIAQQEWEAKRSTAIVDSIVTSIAFGTEAVAFAGLGRYLLGGACFVASVGQQLRAYYLADFVQPPDFTQNPSAPLEEHQ